MSLTPAEEAQVFGNGQILPQGSTTPASRPFAQTFDRRLCTGTVTAPSTGVLNLTAIWLPGGATVHGITFVSGSTAESVGSHLWFALYRVGNVQTAAATVATLMGQGTDDTGAASFGANTAFRQALTTAQVLPYSGLYYLGFCAVATCPTLLNTTLAANGGVNAAGNIAGMTPVLAATADGSLTATAPTTTASLVPIVQCWYAFVD